MKNLSLVILAFVALAIFPTKADAQRDYFTPEEVEMIRDTQKIDDRIALLTKIIDRRFTALKVDSGGAKISAKEAEKWGVLPESTRHELLLDIRRILQKAVDDIDSLAERPDSAILPEPEDKKAKQSFADLFPKAVRNLGSAAQRYRPLLKAELDRPNDNSEKGSVLTSLELCDQIIAAVAKVPAEVEKGKKPKN